MFIDPLYLIMSLPVMLFAMFAQWRVRSTYAAAQRIPASMSGAEAARRILDDSGLMEVGIEPVQGFLSDHYDPRDKVLRLSPDVYQGGTAAAVGIAAHEAGHAIQDASNYAPMALRQAAVPLAALGGNSAMMIFFIGMMFGGAATIVGKWLLIFGIGGFLCVVGFQLINLPCEFDASSRAKRHLAELGITDAEQGAAVRSVLDAAALTYVAATVSAIVTLLWMLIRSGLLGGRNDE